MRMKSLLWLGLSMLICAFDIPVYGIDILPDILGYIILFVCFSVLAAEEQRFLAPRGLTLVSAVLSVALAFSLVTEPQPLLVLQLLLAALDVLLLFLAFDGIGRLARTHQFSSLVKPMDIAFFLYAPAALLPFAAAAMPELSRVIELVRVCLLLYVFNSIVYAYRTLLLPVQLPPPPELADNNEDVLPEETPELREASPAGNSVTLPVMDFADE